MSFASDQRRSNVARSRLSARLAQRADSAAAPSPVAPKAAPQARGDTSASVVPGGWFGGWLGVTPYWNRPGGGGADCTKGDLGVTDGSDARPGQVGEFIQFVVDPIHFAAQMQDQIVTAGALPAGDWDCWATVGFYNPVQSLMIQLNPVPAGFSGGMGGTEIGVSGDTEFTTLVLAPARALTSAASVIAFRIVTNSVQAGTAGTVNLVFGARRMR